MIGAGAAAVLASGVLAWGLPPTAPQPDGIFGTDTALAAGTPMQGDLDKEIIRRIIRRHINEVKYCYEKELLKQPFIGGRIMVQFTVAASGEVIASLLQSSTMGSATVDTCVVQAVRRWQFPMPLGGGIVNITYPFVLTPAAFEIAAGDPKSVGKTEIQPLNPWFFIHTTRDTNGVPANGLIAALPAGLLLVDTGWNEAQTNAILKWGDDTLKRPWIGAVITHEHADRDGGLAALVRRHIPVGALDLTVAKLGARGIGGVQTLLTSRARALNDPRGFELFYPGPGHTSDNIVVAFPERKVVFGGCLFKSDDAPNLGFTGDADRAAWPDSVARVTTRYPHSELIPGHGRNGGITYAAARTRELLGAGVPAPPPPATKSAVFGRLVPTGSAVSAPAAGSSSAAVASPDER
jgi:metallo-beta-lactamase class B